MKNIIEAASINPDFSTLVTAIKAAGLVDALSATGPFTMFAPTNTAFAKIPEAMRKALFADKAKIMKVLLYHVVVGKIVSKDMGSMSNAKTMLGGMIKINTTSGVVINGAKVTTTDIECGNGVIHVIDAVLMPT